MPLPADARFCPSCGTQASTGDPAGVAIGTPSAHAPTTSGAATARRAEPARERKTATMLFADLVGSTALAEAHDPEIVSRLVGGVFERIGDEVRRYEGTIEKFAGDAMLAVFGVPAVHEDDAERAVRAALEIQAAVGRLAENVGQGELRPRLRIGIDTGEVLVDLDRASGARDLFVTGDAVNTAARLQTAAEPGTVIVGAATYAATHDVVDYEELPPAQHKGKADLVVAWRAVTVKARRGGLRSPLGIEAPLIGRQDELGRLKETVRRAATSGRPQLVTVVGAAGVGKSRLTWELEKYLDGLPDTFHWRKGRCLSYAQASYSALADAIKADIRAADDDPATVVAEKLDARLAELGAADDAEVRAILVATLGLDGEAIARDRLVDGWTQYLGLVAAVAPLVLVLEDIHWADEGLLDFIEYLARWGEGRIAVLCLARHELLDRRPTWSGGIPDAATIVLEPLSAGETNQLVDGLLNGGLPELLRDRVVGLAEGNPLFAEELTRMFVDRGVLRLADGAWELARPIEEIEVPSSIQAVLAARLDGLPGDEKRLAQNAAVVGRIFWDVLVAHLTRLGPGPTGDLLRRLRVKELVVPRQPSSLAGAAEFGFRHVLVRDVAYDSLSKHDRATLHMDVAAWAEATLADRVDEFSELIAAHLAAALAYEEELTASSREPSLDGLRELTYRAAVRGARRASSVSAIPAAQRWQWLAIEQAGLLDAPARERMSLAADYYAYVWHEAEPAERVTIFSEALGLFERIADPTFADREVRARLQGALAEATYESNQLDAAQTILREGVAALEDEPPSRGRADLQRVLGWTLWRTGHPSEATPILQRAVTDARTCGSADALRWALHDLGLAMTMSGHMDEGLDLLEESFEMAHDAGDRALLGRCYINLPTTRSERGDTPSGTVRLFEEGLQLARRDGAVATIAWLATNLGYELEDLGRLDESIALAHEALDAASRAGDGELVAGARENLVWGHLLRGDRALAMDEWAKASSASRRPENQGWTAHLEAVVAWADDPERAYRGLEAAFVRLSPDDQAFNAVARGLARMALRLGDRDGLARAANAFLQSTADRTGPVMRIRRRWFGGLASDPDGSDIEAAAGELDAVGYRLLAAYAFADAALIAARTGRANKAEERAMAIAAEIGLHPALGPLPETRWVVVAQLGSHSGQSSTLG
jgi:class 3 adenylate cyclase/tetratricopeptide (TPR) repeat protein